MFLKVACFPCRSWYLSSHCSFVETAPYDSPDSGSFLTGVWPPEEEHRGHQGPKGNRIPSSGAEAPTYILRPAEPAAPGRSRVSRFGSGESHFPVLQGDAEARPSSGALTLAFRTTTHHQRQGNTEGRGLDPVLGFLNLCQ